MQATGAGIGGHDEVLATGTVPAARPGATPTNNVAEQGVPQDTTAIPSRGRGRVRGRGQSGRRGKAQGRTRGGQSRMFNYEDPSIGWRKHEEVRRLMLGSKFTETIISSRARTYCSTILERLDVELKANSLENNDIGISLLLLSDLLALLCKHLNGYIALNEPGRNPFEMADMLKWVAVLLMSSLADISLEKALEQFALRDCKVPSKDKMHFIGNNVIAFPCTKRGNESNDEWASNRDSTQRLDDFERVAYEMSRNVGLSPNFTSVTLDDDLYGTKVHCASGCGRPPLLDAGNSAHVCETCHCPMHAFCVYAPGGELGGEKYEGYGAGGFCKTCSLTVPANST